MIYPFHVDFDGSNWRCYETDDIAREGIVPLVNPVFAADWDGVSTKLSNVVGVIPGGTVPFMGWGKLNV